MFRCLLVRAFGPLIGFGGGKCAMIAEFLLGNTDENDFIFHKNDAVHQEFKMPNAVILLKTVRTMMTIETIRENQMLLPRIRADSPSSPILAIIHFIHFIKKLRV